MGVIVYLAAASDADIDDLAAHPQHFGRFMLGGDLVFDGPEERAGWFRDGVRPKSLQNAKPPPRCDMDKAWAAIHHALSKEGGALLRFLREGGMPVVEPTRKRRWPGEVARAFRPGEVRQLAAELERITDVELAGRLDFAELAKERVYPFAEEWDPKELDYVIHWYQVMRAFVRDAAERGLGVLVGVSA
jgi:hypothetical protein